MFSFKEGYYKSMNGKVVVKITKRTPASVWVNTMHEDDGEAATIYLKRIRIDCEGNEYFITKSGIPVFAEFEATAGEFRDFIGRNFGKPIT